MSIKRRVVIDTVALINFFHEIFEQGNQLSKEAYSIIQNAFDYDNVVLLSIPSIAFIEIFEKWIDDEEFRAKVVAEVLEPIKRAPNIEIKPIDKEVLENFVLTFNSDISLENHDRIILASAAMLNWDLITIDSKIIEFVKKHQIINSIIS